MTAPLSRRRSGCIRRRLIGLVCVGVVGRDGCGCPLDARMKQAGQLSPDDGSHTAVELCEDSLSPLLPLVVVAAHGCENAVHLVFGHWVLRRGTRERDAPAGAFAAAWEKRREMVGGAMSVTPPNSFCGHRRRDRDRDEGPHDHGHRIGDCVPGVGTSRNADDDCANSEVDEHLGHAAASWGGVSASLADSIASRSARVMSGKAVMSSGHAVLGSRFR
nr:MAG TPA: hypothetical protein [Caudoviricetes sp.]